jgi:hypothetical protein
MDNQSAGKGRLKIPTSLPTTPHHKPQKQVQNTIPLGMGGQVVLVSHRRIKIDGPLGVGPPLRVKVKKKWMWRRGLLFLFCFVFLGGESLGPYFFCCGGWMRMGGVCEVCCVCCEAGEREGHNITLKTHTHIHGM